MNMKAFLRKHRFKIVLSLLIIILIYVGFYMLWVHVPYASRQNELTSIQEKICEDNHYTYDNYFNEYHSDKTYYVIKVKQKKKTLYAVFNEKMEKVKSYSGKIVSKNVVKNEFMNKYKVKPTKVEMAYENNKIVYYLMYKGKDSLIYAFYEIDNGDFVKAYKL